MEQEKKLTIEDLQKEVEQVKSQVTTLENEKKELQDKLEQKELELTKLSLGAVKKPTIVVNEEEKDIEFDFDF